MRCDISEEEIDLFIMNLCLEEKPYLEKDEIDFYGRLLELYEENEKNEIINTKTVYNGKNLLKKGKILTLRRKYEN